MRIEGNLQDLSLANLLRLVCRWVRPARLSVTSGDRTATLVVDAGRVVFARAGTKEGEGVLREVLHWTEGVFKMRPARDIPIRNTSAALSDLLPSRSASAGATADEAEQPMNPLAPVDELRFDGEMTDLIARLGLHLQRIEEPTVRRRGVLALPVLEEIFRDALQFLGQWSVPWSEAELRELVRQQAERTPGLAGAEVSGGAILLAGTRGAQAGQEIFFRGLTVGTIGLLTSLLYRLTPRFAEPDRRVLWHETVDALITDLAEALDRCEA